MTFQDRLQQVLIARDVSQAELARRLDVVPSAVNHWLSGRREPASQTLSAAAAVLEVRVAWLAFGDGPMVGNSPAPPPTPPTPKRRTVPPPARSRPKKRTAAKTAARGSKPGVKKAGGARSTELRETG